MRVGAVGVEALSHPGTRLWCAGVGVEVQHQRPRWGAVGALGVEVLYRVADGCRRRVPLPVRPVRVRRVASVCWPLAPAGR